MFRLIAGWTLLGVGFIGLFLPILQGFLMMAAGLALLYGESRLVARIVDRFRPYYRLWRRRYRDWACRRRAKTGPVNSGT